MKRIAAACLGLAFCSTVAVLSGMRSPASGEGNTREPTIKITARKFDYEPGEIHLRVGEPVVLELTSRDVTHGFNIPDLGLRADLKEGQTARVRIVPQKKGTFEFHCDNFCGVRHEEMNGSIVVE
jgi:cytochrome c oxidase subunit II